MRFPGHDFLLCVRSVLPPQLMYLPIRCNMKAEDALLGLLQSSRTRGTSWCCGTDEQLTLAHKLIADLRIQPLRCLRGVSCAKNGGPSIRASPGRTVWRHNRETEQLYVLHANGATTDTYCMRPESAMRMDFVLCSYAERYDMRTSALGMILSGFFLLHIKSPADRCCMCCQQAEHCFPRRLPALGGAALSVSR